MERRVDEQSLGPGGEGTGDQSSDEDMSEAGHPHVESFFTPITPPSSPPDSVLAAAIQLQLDVVELGTPIPEDRNQDDPDHKPIEPWRAAFCAGKICGKFGSVNGKRVDRASVKRMLRQLKKIHRMDLPEPPKRHGQLITHSMGELFLEAERAHLNSHKEMRTWIEVAIDERTAKRRSLAVCGYRRPGTVLRLLKALYGLRESPLPWQREFTGTLTKLGFKPVPHEPCVLTRDGVLIFYYVDDIVITYRATKQATARALIEKLKAIYQLSGGGKLQWFLGIHVVRDRKRPLLWLSQREYIEKIAKLVPKSSRSPPTSPITKEELFPYTGTADPGSTQQYQRSNINGRSARAYTQRSQELARAELLALAQTAKEALFMGRLISEFGVTLDDAHIVINCGNTQTINLVNRDIEHLQTKLRHVDIYNHWLRQETSRGTIRVSYTPTEDMIADGLTKVLVITAFTRFRVQLGIEDISKLRQQEVSSTDRDIDLEEIREAWDPIPSLIARDEGLIPGYWSRSQGRM
ncbi:hypothetical protein DL771_003614 [Monosporascus sp. 5C6A]|nr:hypothetical protein DL771_003614 [Monosporascus sp. 5C6A]